jgi:hypothetical protein
MPVTQYIDNQAQPKVYRALLTQTGTNAPVATVVHNSLGGIPVWTRNAAGEYLITLTGAFPVGKTTMNMKYLDQNIIMDFWNQPDQLFIKNFNNTDDYMLDLPVEILVYL